jgi:hypothetical protein
MIAYFVHNAGKDADLIYMPDMHCFVPVDRERVEAFISVEPDFSNWAGETCELVKPEEFGEVIASREDSGDVCVLNPDLWKARMMRHLGSPL